MPLFRIERQLGEAKSADDIRRHAQMARIPCDAVAEVVEVLPDAYR